MNQIEQHPIFRKFDFRLREQIPGWHIDGLGMRTNADFMDMSDWHVKIKPEAEPGFNEGYFEWIDVLTAVSEAKGRFIMIELGAAYAPWLVCAATALRQTTDLPCYLVAVEAEPTRFEWIHEHFISNNLDPREHLLIKAAVHAKRSSDTWFQVGDPSRSYGAGIRDSNSVETILSNGVRGGVYAMFDRLKKKLRNELRPQKVRAIVLSDILHKLSHVDLLDMDIQGVEAEVVDASIDLMDQKVKRVHIGTHSRDIEDSLRKTFQSHKWKNIYDYSTQTTPMTPYGEITFSDGVQSWINPALQD